MNQNPGDVIEKLHPFERKAFSAMEGQMTLEELSEKSGLKKIEAMRALQWLENKELLRTNTEKEYLIHIGSNGRKYLKEGFPEKRVLSFLSKGPASFEEIKSKLNLEKEEFNMCLGTLKSKAAVEIKDHTLKITSQGEKVLEKESLEEKFLEKLESKGPVRECSLLPEEKHACDTLNKRKDVLKRDISKTRTAELTESGKRLQKKAEKILEKDYTDTLTPEMIKSGAWKEKTFRKYDIRSSVPKICGGKRHFVNQAIENIRRVWLDMGFKEMEGPMLDTSFWNFDALFTAQDHPVRDLQDTFYIKEPAKGGLPGNALVNAVRNAHEKGGTTGSTGWGYKWGAEEAKKNVLRTHTTILSAKTIAKLKKDDLPAKFFSVAKCFRNEALDWSHLFELYQVEGIVVDPNANFRNLVGYLKKFFKKLGFKKIRVQPAYFPYTEPSAEVHAYHPIRKEWIELAGSGIFRPEVVIPLLGEDVPVLAWGMGLERSISEYFNITDIRQLYTNDLKQLREMGFWR